MSFFASAMRARRPERNPRKPTEDKRTIRVSIGPHTVESDEGEEDGDSDGEYGDS